MLHIKKCVVDDYYNYIIKQFQCETREEPLGQSYIIGAPFGFGNFSRIKLEDGIEISKINVHETDLIFDNRKYKDNILEVGYCYSGYTEISSLPDRKNYIVKEGHIFIYNTINNIDYFKFKYYNFKSISIHLNFDSMKNFVSPRWKEKLKEDWNSNIDNIFKGDVLIVEKASYEMKKLAENLDEIATNDVMGYVKLKLKTIEILDTLFQEKVRCENFNNISYEDEEIFTKSKIIIAESISRQVSVKDIANSLNISLYKLQEAFKNITGDTVYEYIKKYKLEKAKHLLKTTDMSILEIVNEIGYENPSKFSALFKRYNNLTPLKYRKLNN